MPMDRKRYPKNWDAISAERVEAAGNQCQKCGAVNGEVIARLDADPFQYRYVELAECEAVAVDGWHDHDYRKPVQVHLTTHHVGVPKPDGSPGDPHDKMDCRPENLLVLCQRCHLLEEGEIMRTRPRRDQPPEQTSFLEMTNGSDVYGMQSEEARALLRDE